MVVIYYLRFTPPWPLTLAGRPQHHELKPQSLKRTNTFCLLSFQSFPGSCWERDGPLLGRPLSQHASGLVRLAPASTSLSGSLQKQQKPRIVWDGTCSSSSSCILPLSASHVGHVTTPPPQLRLCASSWASQARVCSADSRILTRLSHIWLKTRLVP